MTLTMPGTDLFDAIDRLDKAVSQAEAALEASATAVREASQSRDAAIKEAIHELDGLIGSLRKQKGG